MSKFDQYQRPNGLYGVKFIQKWEVYKDGQQAGFEFSLANELVSSGLAAWDKYDAEAHEKELAELEAKARPGAHPELTPRTTPFAHPGPDSENTALVRAPGGSVRPIAGTFATPDDERAALQRRLAQLDDEDADRRAVEDGGNGGAEDGDDDYSETGPADGDPRSDLSIPKGWEDSHHASRKSLATQISGEQVTEVNQANAIIRAELERRQTAG